LIEWLSYDLRKRFGGRILDIDFEVAMKWGEFQGKAEKDGMTMPAIDSLIAATGIAHDLIVVTRNTNDMAPSGVALFNPW